MAKFTQGYWKESRNRVKNSNHKISDHFVEVNKMVSLGLGSEREINDIILTRYACYLIAQNGDPRKEEIAFAQSYFAVQTRKQEIIEEHIVLAERLRAREPGQIAGSKTELLHGISMNAVLTIPVLPESGAKGTRHYLVDLLRVKSNRGWKYLRTGPSQTSCLPSLLRQKTLQPKLRISM